MKNKYVKLISVFALISGFILHLSAGQTALTEDGRRVILNDNGTWAYEKQEKIDYAELKSFLNQAIFMNERYIAEIKQSTGPDSIALAIDNYGVNLRVLLVKNREMEKKYAFLKKLNKGNTPAELKQEVVRMDELTQEIIKLSTDSISKYMTDAKVQKSIQNLGLIMNSIDAADKPGADKKEEDRSKNRQ